MNTITEPHELYELLPKECIKDCTRTGDNYRACKAWGRALGLSLPQKVCLRILSEAGAWEQEDYRGIKDIRIEKA